MLPSVPASPSCWSSPRSATKPWPTRPFVIGRRNWPFADTVAGANASANLYSLLETCKVNGVDGYQYLRALLVALPRARTVEDYEALLPWRLAQSSTP